MLFSFHQFTEFFPLRDVYEENLWELDAVRFRYLYVGLPALDALEYAQGDNWLGVALAALMKIPRDQIALLGAEAQRRIIESPLSEQKRYLLAECVQAYLPVDDAVQMEIDRPLTAEKYSGVKAMNKTWFEKGEEKGMERGRREQIREILEDRFGPLPKAVGDRLLRMPITELILLGKAVHRAQSLHELGLDK